MPCYSCSAEFGILKKEVGCEVCGFSFCSRCCKKHEVPSKTGDPIKQIICNKCFQCLTNNKPRSGKASPPLAHKKRMEALKKQSFSVDSGADMPSLQTQWSCEKDKEIAERLQKLKRDRLRDVLPSEDDIAERLAKLKGMDPAKYKAPPIQVYRPPNLRTSVEQATDLLKQVAVEVELDSRLVKPEDEIAARLARLKDHSPENEKEIKPLSEFGSSDIQAEESTSEDMDIDKASSQLQEQCKSLSGTVSEDLKDLYSDPEYKKIMMGIQKEKDKTEESGDDEEDEANKLVEKLLATDIEELDSLNDDTEESNSKSEKETTEEFPWCVICTEDAKIRCFGCDSDLYCMHCFKECHDSLDIKDHKTCPYLAPKNAHL